MSVIILFGYPGAGKTFAGEIFRDVYGYYFYEGDNELSEEMKQAIASQTNFTEEMRDSFFERLITRVKELTKEHEKIVIAQTFIKEKYRKALLDVIPDAKFVLVQTDESIREKRLADRKDFPLDQEYARKMVENFDLPGIEHEVIENNEEGRDGIRRQIEEILK